MVQEIRKNDFTFDTCVGIKIFENPNVASMLSCRLDFTDSTIHLCAQALLEVKRLGYDVDVISEQIQKSMGVKIVKGKVTDEMIRDANHLRERCPTLHNGDDQILAYARATCTTLVTKDKGLVQAAEMVGTSVINPDVLACDEIRAYGKSRMRRIVDKTICKPIAVKTITRSIVLKPKQNILWGSFQ